VGIEHLFIAQINSLCPPQGLGKTLQGLTLLWTLSTSGHEALGGRPLARRSLIVCPTSLVGNWASEAKKWLQGRLTVLALCEASRDEVTLGIADFLHPSNPYKVRQSANTPGCNMPRR
jgi:DNA repair and recombination RAD54-like protein